MYKRLDFIDDENVKYYCTKGNDCTKCRCEPHARNKDDCKYVEVDESEKCKVSPMIDLFDKKNSIKVFKGKCFGVHLKMRSSIDPYVVYSIIVEDDGNWYDEKVGVSGSGWILDLMDQLIHAMNWMDIYCVKDKHGWTLKHETQELLFKGNLMESVNDSNVQSLINELEKIKSKGFKTLSIDGIIKRLTGEWSEL